MTTAEIDNLLADLEEMRAPLARAIEACGERPSLLAVRTLHQVMEAKLRLLRIEAADLLDKTVAILDLINQADKACACLSCESCCCRSQQAAKLQAAIDRARSALANPQEAPK